jgi:VWFA-related protein
MKGFATRHRIFLLQLILLVFCSEVSLGQSADSSKSRDDKPKGVRVITIPASTRTKGKRQPEEGQTIDFELRENGEEQKILSIRGIGSNPLSLAVLIQDDLVSEVSNDIPAIREFIKTLPRGSRVMVAYMRGGSLEVRQKFTSDLDRAAAALRIPIGFQSSAPGSPYQQIREGLKRFESLPTGRRAMLVVSDGLDTRSGLESTSPGLSLDLDRAIIEAQRRSVAVYSIFAPTVSTQELRSRLLTSNGQGSLAKLDEETGGRLYSQGLSAPVSFGPFLDDIGEALSRQFAITYLSTHPKEGFHRIELKSNRTDIQLDYPKGYLY